MAEDTGDGDGEVERERMEKERERKKEKRQSLIAPTATARPPASWVLTGTTAGTRTMWLANSLRGKKLM
jgi:hypothetical protein